MSMYTLHFHYIFLPKRMISVHGDSVDVDLIPRATQGHCPKGSYYMEQFGTCSCDEHCNWDSCRLTVPPKECLLDIKSKWDWDYLVGAWAAQVIQGI